MAILTRKYFIQTATMITEARALFKDSGEAQGALDYIATGLAEMFAAINSDFKSERFLDDCGVP